MSLSKSRFSGFHTMEDVVNTLIREFSALNMGDVSFERPLSPGQVRDALCTAVYNFQLDNSKIMPLVVTRW